MNTDVAIIGGSFAGLSAALQLARARRSVTVIDAGEPRNRFAAASHGFLTRDGATPAAMLDEARRQLAAYPTARIVRGKALSVDRATDGFAIIRTGGDPLLARRVILAHGVVDSLPDIPGLAAEWGKRVAHCPYCHGYEFNGGTLGVLANGTMATHHAMLVREWGPVTLFLNRVLEPSSDELEQLAARGVSIERRLVTAAVARDDALSIELDGGDALDLAGLFTQPRSRLSSDIGERLGCNLADSPFGPILAVDEMKQTSVLGVFAAGDAARPAPNVPFAVADGAMAGVAAHRSLVFG